MLLLIIQVLLKVINLGLASILVCGILFAPGVFVFERYKKQLKLQNYHFWMVLLTTSALVALTTFWIYFFSATLGKILGAIFTSLSLWYCFRLVRERSVRNRPELLFPLLSLLLSIAFYNGLYSVRMPLGVSQIVGTHLWSLPGDNFLPYNFGEKLFNGDDPRDAGSTWRSSDRPPLQAGYWLTVKPIFNWLVINELGYHALAGVLQASWVLALFSLLHVFRASAAQGAFTFLFCLFSGFFYVNTMFAWPKLIAATFCIFSMVLLLYRENNRTNLVLAGLCAGLGMLAHGGSAFFLMVLLPWWGIARSNFSVRKVALVTIPLFVLLVGWSAYQRFYDPPGNRLLKMHLAGVDDPLDTRSTLETLLDNYASHSLDDILNKKKQNLIRPFRNTGVPLWQGLGPEAVLWSQFFDLGNTLDVLLLGFLGVLMALIAARSSSPRLKASRVYIGLFSLCLLVYVVWALLLFDEGATIIHSGTYVLPVLLFFGLSGVLYQWLKNWIVVPLIIHAGIFWYAWGPRGIPAGGWVWLLVSLAAFVALIRLTRNPHLFDWGHVPDGG